MSTTLSPIASPDFAERTLADLAVTLPGATAVFRRRKLDFCCGGNISLRDAMQAKGQALDELQDELAQLVQAGGTPDAAQDVPALIERIETRYHAVHRRELPELARLARRVEAVHRENPGVPRGLADLLDRMTVELESHMQKEEQVLFPLMLQGGHPMIGHPIAMMLSEHDDHGAHLRSLEALTQDFTLPEGACTSWRALYAGARKFADDLVEHIHTENNILFPRFSN